VDIVSNLLVLPVTILKMLIGLVNHVTLLVVNVLVHLLLHVLNVVQLIPILIYMKDLVSSHVQMVTMLTMDIVKYVMTNVVLVVVLLKIPVSPVVITYSSLTMNVLKNVQKDIIEMKLPTPVKLVTILVILVTVQMLKIVILVNHQITYTSILKT